MVGIDDGSPTCDASVVVAGQSCAEVGYECFDGATPGQGCACRKPPLLWECGLNGALGISETAPICEDTYESGYLGRLDEEPCDTEWQLCIARDYNPEGTSPRGCACLRDGGDLAWSCGATNRWWRAE